MKKQRKAIFLDRDGVINKEKGYITSWADFELLPNTLKALQLIQQSEYLSIVITNQSGIAKGLYTEAELMHIHEQLNRQLSEAAVEIDAFYFCPHHVDGIIKEYTKVCDCKKPNNGLILKAAQDYNINLEASYLIGDSERDVFAGNQSGCTTFGVKTGHGATTQHQQADFVVKDILEAVQTILYSK